MKRVFLLICCCVFYATSNAQSFNWQWVRNGAGPNDTIVAIAHDLQGNLLVCGSFFGDSVNIGDTTLFATPGYPGKTFIGKYSIAGNLIWVKCMSIRSGRPIGIATDSNGNVFVAGDFSGSLVILDTDTLHYIGAGQSAETFAAKYDNNGNLLWAKYVGNVYCDGIAADGIGNSYLTGFPDQDTVVLGTDTLIDTLGGNIVTIKYDPSGNIIWVREGAINGNAVAFGTYLTTDFANNVYVAGKFALNSSASATLSFGNTTILASQTAQQGQNTFHDVDVFIVKYNSSGDVIWAQSAGVCCAANISGMSINSKDELYVTGYFSGGEIDFNSSSLFNNNPSSNCFFIAKFGVSGQLLWAKASDVGSQPYGNNNIWGRQLLPIQKEMCT